MCLYFVRSILQCEQTGYEAESCVSILLALYFSVNRQDMKLGRVSVFYYNKCCRLRDKMQ